jgi:GNAT superfamily N-acetyltransferase
VAGAAPHVRPAREEDLAAIVRLLADDPLAAEREGSTSDVTAYRDAFREIAADPSHELLVLDVAGRVAGVLQLSFLRCLTYRGGRRAQVEGVRVDPSLRGRGLGALLVQHAVTRARKEGCHLVQLTTDRRRPDAVAFYAALGFVDSHHGMKLTLG